MIESPHTDPAPLAVASKRLRGGPAACHACSIMHGSVGVATVDPAICGGLCNGCPCLLSKVGCKSAGTANRIDSHAVCEAAACDSGELELAG